MDNATNNYDLNTYDQSNYDIEKWLEITNSPDSAKQNRREKKRRKPLRKNRKPSRPSNYIGQRTNNHLQRIMAAKALPDKLGDG